MKLTSLARPWSRPVIVAPAMAMLALSVMPSAAHASPRPAPAQAPAVHTPAVRPAPDASARATTGKTPTSTSPKCGGPLAFGEVAVCPSIAPADRDIFQATSTVDGDSLFTMFPSSGDPVSAVVTDSNGDTACSIYPDASTCQLGAAGVYTITVSLTYGTGGSYSLSLESRRTPSTCKALSNSFFSFASQGLSATMTSGSAARCFSFNQPTGSLLYTEAPGNGEVEGPVLDAQYRPVCHVRYATTCTLSQPGLYHLFLYDDYGSAAPYTLRLPRISASAGCGVVRPTAFGDHHTAAGTGTVTYQHVTCNKVKAPIAGVVSVRFSPDQNLWWTLYDDAGKQVCDESADLRTCSLPSGGDYTMLVQDQGFGEVTYQVGVTALYNNAGCAAATGTSWDLPALLVHQTSGVQVNCQPFHGRAGDRIVTYAEPTVFNSVTTSLVDSKGAIVCPDYSDQDGCVLPATGTYRVLSYLHSWDDQVPDATYMLQIRRLSSPKGCPTIRPGAYDAAPAGALGGIRCRILAIPTAGSYLLAAVDAQNYVSYSQVYDSSGLKVCSRTRCDLTAPGRYTMVLNGSATGLVIDNDFQYAVALLSTAPSGCPQVSDDPTRPAAYSAQFTAAGEYDCLRLASPAGARIMELRPEDATGAGNPSVTVVDATGNFVCESSYTLRQQSCQLTGPAPFYAVYTPVEGAAPGAYKLMFPRVDGAPACPALPRTADGATVSTSADQFTGCFSVPADQHAAQETFTYQRTSGAGGAGLAVFGSNGTLYCGLLSSPAAGRTSTCTLPDGPLTVVLEGSAVDATYRVTYADASTTSP